MSDETPRVIAEESKSFVRAHADAASIAFHNGTFRLCFLHEIPAHGEVTISHDSGESVTERQQILVRQPEAEIIMSPDLLFKLKRLLDQQAGNFLSQLQTGSPEIFEKRPDHWR